MQLCPCRRVVRVLGTVRVMRHSTAELAAFAKFHDMKSLFAISSEGSFFVRDKPDHDCREVGAT